MANKRSKTRQRLIQAVYQWKLTGSSIGAINEYFHVDTNKSIDKLFFKQMLEGIVTQHQILQEEYLAQISRAPESLDEITKSILLLGTFELTCLVEIPYKVTINEYLELAKKFGSQDCYKLINAVLDRIVIKHKLNDSK